MLQPDEILQKRYKIVDTLGSGGIGAVYRAVDLQCDNVPVAIKETSFRRDSEVNWKQAMESFRAEVHTLVSLNHPSLVPLWDYFEGFGSLYLVMDLAPGRSLELVIQESLEFEHPLPLSFIVASFDQLCSVLHYLHSQSPPILYCDLKPSNAVVDDAGRIRLIDFGAAFDYEASGLRPTHRELGGTPCFAPLEQYEGTVDGRTDVYALGATLYSLLTRRLPPPAVDIAQGRAELVPPSQVNPDLPLELDALVARMMAVRRERRHRTVVGAWQEMLAQADRMCPELQFAQKCQDCGTPLPITATGCYRCTTFIARLVRPRGRKPSAALLEAASGNW